MSDLEQSQDQGGDDARVIDDAAESGMDVTLGGATGGLTGGTAGNTGGGLATGGSSSDWLPDGSDALAGTGDAATGVGQHDGRKHG